MTEAFRRGDDLHTITAARVSGKRPEEVTKAERQAAKATNFGSLYGIGAVQADAERLGRLRRQALDRAKRARSSRRSQPPTPISCAGATSTTSGASIARCIVIGRDAARGIDGFAETFPGAPLRDWLSRTSV